MTIEQFIFVGLVFFAAHMLSTITGFGAGVLGVPLLALVFGLEPGKQALVLLGMMLYTYVMVRHRAKVNWSALGVIVLICGAGLIVGLVVIKLLPPKGSNALLACFVVIVGTRGLLNIAPKLRPPMWLGRILLFAGGIVHGAFTTGGPLIVIYTRQALPHKSVFRATLAVVWFILGVGLIIGWTISHSWVPQTPKVTLVGLPFLALGTAVGEVLHHRVDERHFRTLVNVTLIATGGVLLWHTLK